MIRLLALAALLVTTQVHALNVPVLQGRVNDTAGILTAPQRAELEAKLKGIEDATGHQFVFLSVPTLAGGTIEELATATLHAWKLGDAKRDDGLLFVIATGERKTRLEVGYGLEGMIPDATAVRIVRDVASPLLKRGDFAGAFAAVFDACVEATKVEKVATPTEQPKPRAAVVKVDDGVSSAAWWFFGIFGSALAAIGLMSWRDRKEEQRRLAEIEREENEARTWLARTRAEAPERVQRPFVSHVARRISETPPPTRRKPVARPSPASTTRTRYESDDDDRKRRDSDSSSTFDFGSSSSGGFGGGGFDGGGGDGGGGGASGDY